MLTVVAIIHLVCRHSKLKALLTGIAFQLVNQAEAAVTKQAKEFCTAQWYTIAALTVLTILLIVYICLSNQKCAMFKRRLYSSTVTITLFFSDIMQYVPVKLCKTAGSIHLFQIYGQLDSNQIILEKNCLWDMIKIDCKEVFVTLNGTIVRMPKTVKVPLRDKYRLRTLMDKHSLLLHIMLRQGTSWYTLDKMDSEILLPPITRIRNLTLHFRMANELNITQEFRMMTLNLPANTVTVQIVVKTLKGQYLYCQNNNHRETTFNPWSEDLQPTESFMRLVRETQIRPDRYYLEMTMHQTLGKIMVIVIICQMYGYMDSYHPEIIMTKLYKFKVPAPPIRVIDNNKDESKEQTEQPTEQIVTLTGTRVPQDILMDNSATLRLLQTMTQVLKNTETKWQDQKDQTTLHDLDMEKATKSRWPGTEIRTMGERKWKSILFIDVVI